MTRAVPRIDITGFSEDRWAELTDLWVASWTRAMPQIDFEARRPWFRSYLDALHGRGVVTTCALDEQGRLLGFVTIDPANGELDQIAVAPSSSGQGIGHLLLEEARRLAPGRITLTVNQDNAGALNFYAREGFVRTAEGVNAMSGLKTFRMEWRL